MPRTSRIKSRPHRVGFRELTVRVLCLWSAFYLVAAAGVLTALFLLSVFYVFARCYAAVLRRNEAVTMASYQVPGITYLSIRTTYCCVVLSIGVCACRLSTSIAPTYCVLGQLPDCCFVRNKLQAEIHATYQFLRIPGTW